MERFYVLESGTMLRKSGENLVVTRGGDAIAQIPLQGLEQLTIVGYSSLTGSVLDTLIRHRIETVLMSPQGRFRARLMVDEHKHVQRRQAQYLRLSDPANALVVARQIVAGKLRNSARFVALRGKQYSDPTLQKAAVQIKALTHMVGKAADLEVLRGIEGHGASLYYRAFPRLIRVEGFPFNGRNRRPPLDPVNALLSFVYTLLTLEVLTAIKIAGLDPYLGSLHAVDYGRPSLACDLVEEWRAFWGDRLALSLINRQILSPEDFVVRELNDHDGVDEEDLRRKRPVEMKPKICRAFLETYEKWMSTVAAFPGEEQKSDYRGFIRHQVRKFSDYLTGNRAEYEPFVWSQVF